MTFAPKEWVTGELVTADALNTFVSALLREIGEWAPGDLKASYATNASAVTSELIEAQQGWFIANGAAYTAATYPVMHANLGSPSPAVLPDYRGRGFLAPGTQSGLTLARGDLVGAAPSDIGEAFLVGGMVLIKHDWV